MVAVDEKDFVKFYGKYGMKKKDFFNMLLTMELPIWLIMVAGVLLIPRDTGDYTTFYMGVALFGVAFIITLLLRRKYLKEYAERTGKGAA